MEIVWPFKGASLSYLKTVISCSSSFRDSGSGVGLAAGIGVAEAEIGMIPQNSVLVEGKDAEQLLKLTEALEDDDDVSKVFSNFDIDQDTLAAVGG